MSTTEGIAARTLIITREFAAPPKVVFEAWTKPEHLVRWFGPNDFTLPTCEQDLRVGGKYRFCMHSPDGSDHWVWGEYREISEFDRLVFTWTRNDDKPQPWVDNTVTLTFKDLGDRTRMTMHHALFDTEQHRDEHNGGWSECFDRLSAFVNHFR